MMHTISFGPWGFIRLPCLRQVPLLRRYYNARRIDTTLVRTNLVWWHLRWTLCLGASCSKDPEEEECLRSLALITVFTTSHHLAIVVASHGQRIHPWVRGVHSLTGAEWSWMTVTLMTAKQSLFPMASYSDTASRSSSPQWYQVSVLGAEEWA